MALEFEQPTGKINPSLNLEDVNSLVDTYIKYFMEDKVSIITQASIDTMQTHIFSFLSNLLSSYFTSDDYFSIPNKYRPYASLRVLSKYTEYIQHKVLFFIDDNGVDFSKHKPTDFIKELGVNFDRQQLEKEAAYMDEIETWDTDNINTEVEEYNPVEDLSFYHDPLHDLDLPKS